jgi:hypothetical protein
MEGRAPETRHIISALTTETLCFDCMTLFENAYNEIAELVRKWNEHQDQFMAHKYLDLVRSDSELGQFQRKCKHIDAEIDKLVYALYGLTEEEIKIVEG